MVYKDYYTETYNQALDRAGVPTESDLRRVDQVYYPEDIREDTTALPPPAALPLPPLEQSLITQEPSQGAEIPAGAQKEKKGEVVASRIEEKAKEKGKEKAKSKADANPSEDALTIEDMVPRLKLLNPSPRLTPRKILINHRLRYRVLAFFFLLL